MSRQNWKDRLAERTSQVEQRVANFRARTGVRTVPLASRLDFRCGHAACELPFGHHGDHGNAAHPPFSR